MKSSMHIALVAALLLGSCHDGTQQQQSAPDTFASSTTTTTTTTADDATSRVAEKASQSGSDSQLLDVAMPRNGADQLLRYKVLTIHFDKQLRIPRCVAYELTKTHVTMADAPDAERRDNYNFDRDPKAEGCPDWWEYKNTGYDRGHMAPAMDMRWDKTAMSQCFLMTNICPQNHELNDGEWRHMEEAIHTWARHTDRLLIFTGPVLGSNMAHIGKHHDIAVPTRFFKVVYDPGNQRAIAFVFDNKKAERSWTSYAVDVDDVERLTGIDFLRALPDDVETRVESRHDVKNWPQYTPRR